ncbi:hypothetical protein DFH09DRAFT_1100374 [Mycena vulgaris]|nr:hypothetical protein DFH09DRAFT_1100374 [Mycena vulgaris]
MSDGVKSAKIEGSTTYGEKTLPLLSYIVSSVPKIKGIKIKNAMVRFSIRLWGAYAHLVGAKEWGRGIQEERHTFGSIGMVGIVVETKKSFKLVVMIAVNSPITSGHDKFTPAHSLIPLSKRKLYHCDQLVKPDSSIPFKSKSWVLNSYLVQTNDHLYSLLPPTMGTRTVGSRKSQEGSSSYKPRLSEAEKAKRARKAVATHYRNHPELREKNKLAKRASRAAKKLAKRKWDPPKKQKVVTEEIISSDEEILTSDEGYLKFTPRICGPQTPSPTVSELCGVPFAADPPNDLETRGEDKEVASQVLTSMYLARQHQMESLSAESNSGTCALGVHGLIGALTTPKHNGRAGRESSKGDSLPPSSPPPISPADPRQAHQVIAPGKSGGWVSPGEWDDPGSPLPSSAYERMPWPQLFKSLFGPKGDAEPDADDQSWLDGAIASEQDQASLSHLMRVRACFIEERDGDELYEVGVNTGTERMDRGAVLSLKEKTAALEAKMKADDDAFLGALAAGKKRKAPAGENAAPATKRSKVAKETPASGAAEMGPETKTKKTAVGRGKHKSRTALVAQLEERCQLVTNWIISFNALAHVRTMPTAVIENTASPPRGAGCARTGRRTGSSTRSNAGAGCTRASPATAVGLGRARAAWAGRDGGVVKAAVRTNEQAYGLQHTLKRKGWVYPSVPCNGGRAGARKGGASGAGWEGAVKAAGWGAQGRRERGGMGGAVKAVVRTNERAYGLQHTFKRKGWVYPSVPCSGGRAGARKGGASGAGWEGAVKAAVRTNGQAYGVQCTFKRKGWVHPSVPCNGGRAGARSGGTSGGGMGGYGKSDRLGRARAARAGRDGGARKSWAEASRGCAASSTTLDESQRHIDADSRVARGGGKQEPRRTSAGFGGSRSRVGRAPGLGEEARGYNHNMRKQRALTQIGDLCLDPAQHPAEK